MINENINTSYYIMNTQYDMETSYFPETFPIPEIKNEEITQNIQNLHNFKN